ncbi:N-acetyltransferase 9 [Polychytrium aggregatum]|uniref:N-acetyltransferase 9 n=1 Tax=Polychytrium aggregatum TaxID=110093 RepID=UPI0022FE9E58|nr:N-acetyltransferase 9 [Polychytrium aggregatum]KAI9202783.1 N-acetyltransferase 9 [Polychytrium aggregatum]
MKVNSNVVLKGSKAILVPYKREHVLIYHEWMKDPFLQEMTASEPLTLEEEYEMQQSWYEDEKKCTFILLSSGMERNRVGISAQFGGMVGDVNLYFNDFYDPHVAEIEIMVAEEEARGQGLGLEALRMMMRYAVERLSVKSFVSKISLKNESSQRLFRERLSFVEESVSQAFQEVTLVRPVDDVLVRELAQTVQWEERIFE